jgi:hypothetical protein
VKERGVRVVFVGEEEDERCGREKKETEKTCVVGRGKRERKKKKSNFCKKSKSKKYYFNDIGNC